jgi:hypothetical protein
MMSLCAGLNAVQEVAFADNADEFFLTVDNRVPR